MIYRKAASERFLHLSEGLELARSGHRESQLIGLLCTAAYLLDLYAFDARNNMPRMARVLMAIGLDAVDVPIVVTFGIAHLARFEVVSTEAPISAVLGGRY